MISFIFEQYGYYPKNFISNTFEIDNWIFKLIEVDGDEEYLNLIDSYINVVREKFPNNGIFIIKSRFNKKIVIYDNKKYVLVSCLKGNLNIKDLNKFHYIFKMSNEKVNLNNLASTWEERLNFIEKNAITSLRIDSVYYKDNLQISMYIIGITQNSIQYLSELILDFNSEIDNVSLTHKRLEDLNSFDFFNPFNYIIDHPIRDLIELYKCNILTFSDLIDLFEYYKLDSKLASYVMVRYLYPGKILDELENNINKNDSGFKLKYNFEIELQKTKKIYLYLKEKYNIRPINWLEN